MRKFTSVFQDEGGNIVAGAELYVRKQGDGSLLTLYSDDGVTQTANPAVSGSDGYVTFYTANNVLKLELYVDGELEKTIEHYQHFDFSELTDPGADRIAFWDDSASDMTWLALDTGLSISGTTLSLDSDLAALAANSTDGLWAHTGAGTGAARTITGTANEVDVANGSGAAGNPTISLPSAITLTGKTITGGSVTPAAAPSTTAIGYLGSPINTQDANYTTVMSDAGKTLYHTSASTHTWTIDSNANVAYPVGTQIGFSNENGGGNVTIAITSDTLRWGSSTGSRTLAANGSAVAQKMTSTSWRLTGDGIS